MILSPAQLNLLLLASPCGVVATGAAELELRRLTRSGLMVRDRDGSYKPTAAGRRRFRAEWSVR